MVVGAEEIRPTGQVIRCRYAVRGREEAAFGPLPVFDSKLLFADKRVKR